MDEGFRCASDGLLPTVVAGVPNGDEARAANLGAAEDIGAHPRCRASDPLERLLQITQQSR